jgi:hypothetical protein
MTCVPFILFPLYRNPIFVLENFEPMVVCYGCSITCHGHHEGLIES